MNTTTDSNRANSSAAQRVVVVGGGLSGLTAAYRLVTLAKSQRRPIQVTLLEARDRVGGAIETIRRDGFTIENGPDSFISNKPWAVDLCRELGLGDQLIPTDERYRRSFVLGDGRLHPVPDGFVLMAPSRIGPIVTTPLLSLRGKFRLLLDLVRPRKTDDSDESIGAFAKRRFGREALDRLIQPLVGGIWTGDPNDLSLRSTLPQFVEMEKKHGSIIRAALYNARHAKTKEKGSSGARYGLFLSLLDGMDTLPRTLAHQLPPGTIRTNTAVRRVTRDLSSGLWRVELLDGPAIEAGAVIMATEAHASARLLDGYDPTLALHLRSIPYASSAIVNVGFRRDQVSHPLDGFGLVIPGIEKRRILAVSFLSVKFPMRAPAGSVVMRVFVGGAMQPELFDLDDEAMSAVVREELAALLGTTGEPLFLDINRHARAMPQYTLGHDQRVATIRQQAAKHAGLILTSIAFDGVGIPDCIRAAQEAADRTLRSLADPAAPTAA